MLDEIACLTSNASVSSSPAKIVLKLSGASSVNRNMANTICVSPVTGTEPTRPGNIIIRILTSCTKKDFSNVLSKSAIEGLAEADSFELVREVQEFFADYSPILPYLFSLNHTPSEKEPLYGSSSTTWNTDALKSSVHGLAAVLLSLKKKPLIRFERMSPMARRLGSEVKVSSNSSVSLCTSSLLL